MILVKEFEFDAAHNLVNYHGKCENLHGHTYKLVIKLKGNRIMKVWNYGYFCYAMKDVDIVRVSHPDMKNNILFLNPCVKYVQTLFILFEKRKLVNFRRFIKLFLKY